MKKILLGLLFSVYFVSLFVSCSSTPTTPSFTYYDTYADVDISEEVLYTVTDQQAFALAKAWITLRSAQYKILTDDSEGGVLAVAGDVNSSINKGNGLFPHYFTCRIFVANGIAKLNYNASIPRARGTSQANAQSNAENTLKDHVIWQTSRTFKEVFN
jgi:hypothetical protein